VDDPTGTAAIRMIHSQQGSATENSKRRPTAIIETLDRLLVARIVAMTISDIHVINEE
jgi:hypothetical protein